ncbi:MAG: hypothetical protein WCW26_02920 [Candidatus Buchananbacteria bacterium]
MLTKIKDDFFAIGFFAVVAILLIWQMFLPGYVLSLDMIFTPKLKILLPAGEFYNSLPLRWLLWLVNIVLPGWLIQKIIIFVLFFSAGFLAYRYLPVPKKNYAPIWAGLFYVVNPFVYERFLAGHWLLLLAYAILPIFIAWLLVFFEKPNWLNILKLVFCLLLIAVFSLHILTMAIMIFSVYSLYQVVNSFFEQRNKLGLRQARGIALVIISLVIFSSYWLLPYLLTPTNFAINNFSQSNWEVFKTVGDKNLNPLVNVSALYGFWGEGQIWANYFLWPKANFSFWLALYFSLVFLVVLGFYASLKNKNYQRTGFFALVGLFSFIFACGAGDTIFKNLNLWLFNQLWFWSGFRDSQKWSAWLVLSYAYFGSFGASYFIDYVKKVSKLPVKFFVIMVFLVPTLYTYTVWGGFARQLKPVWYPASWTLANEILNQDQSDFKVLFLPWHQYLSFDFNQRLIIQNPAKDFFDKEIIQGENMEIGSIYSQSDNQPVQAVENILLSSQSQSSQETLSQLAGQGIKYIIFTHDLDSLPGKNQYQPQASQDLAVIFNSKDLTIFEIMLR